MVMVCPATVSVPERAGPLVAAAFTETVPLPFPLAPLAIVIHDAWLVAVHAQPAPAVTVTVPLPPEDGTESVCGAAANVQPWPWVTVTVCPATVTVPVRAGPLVAAAFSVTVPLPLPLAPLAIVIHDVWLLAVHAQPAPDVTATVPLPPEEAIGSVCGVMVNVQPCDCNTVTVWPATVSVPVLDAPLVAATLNATEPRPVPLAPAVTVIHGSREAAVQAQPLSVPTLTVRVPPAASMVCVSGVTSKAQPGDCVTVKVSPAIVAVPVRVGPAVGAIVTATTPLPLPDAVPSEIQLALLVAVHGQPAPAVTVTDADPPLLPAANAAGAIA